MQAAGGSWQLPPSTQNLSLPSALALASVAGVAEDSELVSGSSDPEEGLSLSRCGREAWSRRGEVTAAARPRLLAVHF